MAEQAATLHLVEADLDGWVEEAVEELVAGLEARLEAEDRMDEAAARVARAD